VSADTLPVVLIAASEDEVLAAIAHEIPTDRFAPLVARGWAQVEAAMGAITLDAAVVHYVLEDIDPMAFCSQLRALEGYEELPLLLLLPGVGRSANEGEPFDIAMGFPAGPKVLADNLAKAMRKHDARVETALADLEKEVVWRTTQLDEKTYYEILGVTPSATRTEIVDGYDKLSLRFHPDRITALAEREDMKALCDTLYLHVTEAYQTLSDATHRKKYDKLMAAGKLRFDPTRRGERARQLIDIVSNATAKRYISKAEAELRQGNKKSALMWLDMAKQVEKNNVELERRIEKIQES